MLGTLKEEMAKALQADGCPESYRAFCAKLYDQFMVKVKGQEVLDFRPPAEGGKDAEVR